MSSYNKPKIVVKLANGDLSAKQYCFVKFTASTDGQKVSICGAGDKALGVVMNAPVAGEEAEVAKLHGGALLKLAGTIAAGDSIKPDANGAGVVGATGDMCSAIAQEDGVAGDVISVDIHLHKLP